MFLPKAALKGSAIRTVITTQNRSGVTQFSSLEAGHFPHSFEAPFASNPQPIECLSRRSEPSGQFDAMAYDHEVMSSKGKLRLNSLRTWNRRDFSVRPAGWFTVLKPSGWFAASRLPGGFRYLGGQPGVFSSPQARIAQDHAASQETTMRLQTMEPNAQDHPLIRPALIGLAATAIMSIVLLWLCHP